MKKVVALLLGTVLLLMFSVGNVFADEPELEKTVDEVIGTPYKWGGTTVDGFDCSGFILYVYKQFDVKLPRTSKTQAQAGTKVDKDELRAGDLVFFNIDGTGVSHAGIYLGNGDFAHSSSSKGVRINKLSETYYAKRYATARRVISEQDFRNMKDKEHNSDVSK